MRFVLLRRGPENSPSKFKFFELARPNLNLNLKMDQPGRSPRAPPRVRVDFSDEFDEDFLVDNSEGARDSPSWVSEYTLSEF